MIGGGGMDAWCQRRDCAPFIRMLSQAARPLFLSIKDDRFQAGAADAQGLRSFSRPTANKAEVQSPAPRDQANRSSQLSQVKRPTSPPTECLHLQAYEVPRLHLDIAIKLTTRPLGFFRFRAPSINPATQYQPPPPGRLQATSKFPPRELAKQ